MRFNQSQVTWERCQQRRPQITRYDGIFMNALDKHGMNVTPSYMTSLSVSKKKKVSLIGRNPRK